VAKSFTIVETSRDVPCCYFGRLSVLKSILEESGMCQKTIDYVFGVKIRQPGGSETAKFFITTRLEDFLCGTVYLLSLFLHRQTRIKQMQ